MARTNKTGIDYFPLDVDLFSDDKVQLIEAEFGIKGGYIIVRLLCKIYREGYFYQWGGDACLLFTKNMGAEFVPNMVNEVINGLVRRCFFDKGCFDRFGILTSKGIQNRYFEAAKRYNRVDVIKDYLLVDVSKFNNVHIIEINADINTINADINSQKKREEKKGKKEKEKSFSEKFLNFQKWIDKNASNVAKMKEPFTENEYERLMEEYSADFVKGLLLDMHNWKDLLKKNVNANLTFRKWAKKRI